MRGSLLLARSSGKERPWLRRRSSGVLGISHLSGSTKPSQIGKSLLTIELTLL